MTGRKVWKKGVKKHKYEIHRELIKRGPETHLDTGGNVMSSIYYTSFLIEISPYLYLLPPFLEAERIMSFFHFKESPTGSFNHITFPLFINYSKNVFFSIISSVF